MSPGNVVGHGPWIPSRDQEVGRSTWPARWSRHPTSMMPNQRRGSWRPTQNTEALQPPTMKAPPPERTGRLTRALSGGMSARTRACHARIRSLVSAGLSTRWSARQDEPRPPFRAIGVPLTPKSARTSFGSDPGVASLLIRNIIGNLAAGATTGPPATHGGVPDCATQCVKPPGHKTSCQSSAVGNGSSAPTIEFLEDLRSQAIRHLARRWAHTDADNMTDQGERG